MVSISKLVKPKSYWLRRYQQTSKTRRTLLLFMTTQRRNSTSPSRKIQLWSRNMKNGSVTAWNVAWSCEERSTISLVTTTPSLLTEIKARLKYSHTPFFNWILEKLPIILSCTFFKSVQWCTSKINTFNEYTESLSHYRESSRAFSFTRCSKKRFIQAVIWGNRCASKE